ncbi:MAG: glutamate-1-semialdehyde 2,1-aminomutase [Candidatus Binatia bacterium]|nr:MAG: glutamate-1-semialdehyde 2,1-aminomutase [Candidatus Binatia bacterium]
MGEISRKLFSEARRVIPGGVNSPVRAWKAVGGEPVFLQRGRGCHVTDADGRTYTDYVCSWGPLILGHAHPSVLRAVQDALRDGTSFGAPTAREIELAQKIVGAVPSVRSVRLVNSGTEATMSALRLARAFTGRTKVLKFAGCYHGHVDSLLVAAGSGAMTFGVPESPGVPEVLARETLVARFNDLESVDRCFEEAGSDLAAVIVEPVPANMGVVPPEPGFLEKLQERTRARGALLIFDEVVTGFRLGWGGAQGRFGLEPDLTCLGKIIGGGLPVGAFGGRRDVMAQLAPVGPVYQAGTLSGNPLSVAAGIATLRALEQPRVYDQLEELSARLEQGLRGAAREEGVPVCINRFGSMFTVFFGVDRVRNADDAAKADTRAYARFFRGMLERGFYFPPSQFEAAFVSLAHSADEIELTIRAARDTFAEMRREVTRDGTA